jgi:hypothetical protein
MKISKVLATSALLLTFHFSNAQEKKKDSILGKENYYRVRAKEDARFEQEFNSKSKSDDKKFWKEQKQYEKELENRDEEAHKAYMRGKRDAYAEHSDHCNKHCNHGYYYQYHVNYYYHSNPPRERRYNRGATQTRIKIRTPSLGINIF